MKKPGKHLINSGEIDGIQLLEMKFPSLTRRQINELYAFATKLHLTLEEIVSVEMLNPLAKMGESFVFSISNH